MSQLSSTRSLYLFGATFGSAFLMFFGVGMLLLTFAPALAAFRFSEEPTPYSMLPLPTNREEEFLEIRSIPAKQLFPALPEITDVQQGDWIRVPSIGVHVPLALSPSLNDADVIATLTKGVALYPNGIKPGHLGNTFIAAHSTGNPWHGAYRFAFLKINEVQPGHVVHLDYKGTRYTYRVAKSEIVKPTANSKVVSDRPVPTVTLMACWPLWSTTNRMLVTGQLTNITKLQPDPS